MRLAVNLLLASLVSAAESGYVGSRVCGKCHRDIAATQSTTRMARTWQGLSTTEIPAVFAASTHEGSIEYRVRRSGDVFAYQVAMPQRSAISLPIEVIVGGPRLGRSLLARVSEIGGLKLDRAPLVEARYLTRGDGRGLALSPGFPAETPVSYETALGRVLNPSFEAKCLQCHGAPRHRSQEAGVRCEHCHGPGQAHVRSIAKGAVTGIINPARLSNAERIAQCGQCHADGRNLADAMPEDLLISDQADALVRSECYIQSGQGLNCGDCHNPHQDSPQVARRSVKVCLTCHPPAKKLHAVLCPVNAKDGCATCHMKSMPVGAFRMTDHWIRVHPEDARGLPGEPALRGTMQPRQVFLRLIAASERSTAEHVRSELLKGASFLELARARSTHSSAISGGFLGLKSMEQLDPNVAQAAAALAPGELSSVVETGGEFLILQRLPRDFRWQADRRYEEAQQLKARGEIEAALQKNQQALEIYPTFLRALVLLGSTLGEQGEVGRAVAVLEHAARLYPEDPGAQLNLGVAYGAAGRTKDEIRAYERVIEKEPGVIAAYMNLGAALLASGDPDRAAEVFRKGLNANPLSAVLYYNLSLVSQQQGRTEEAKRALALAEAINAEFVRSQTARDY